MLCLPASSDSPTHTLANRYRNPIIPDLVTFGHGLKLIWTRFHRLTRRLERTDGLALAAAAEF